MPKREADRLNMRRKSHTEVDEQAACEPPQRSRSGHHTYLFVRGRLYASPDSTGAPIDSVSFERLTYPLRGAQEALSAAPLGDESPPKICKLLAFVF